MASFQKRPRGWRVEVQVKGYRECRTFDTKAQAQAWAALKETELRQAIQSGVVSGKTVLDALDRYAREVSPTKRGQRWEVLRVALIGRTPLANVKLSDLLPEHIAYWRDERLRQVTGATVNRELSLISHVFSVAAKEWRWITKSPTSDVRRAKPSLPRDRLIAPKEIERLLLAAGWSNGEPVRNKTHAVAVAFLFAIETAMRAGEICSLRKTDITGRVAQLCMTKNGSARQVPLSSRALELLSYLPEAQGTLFGMLPSQLDALFRKLKSISNIENLHFHDTRHEAITRLSRKLDVLALARMVGHKDLRQLQIYYNETAEELATRLDQSS
ncbi:MAG: site-specific integrase [Ottowia sp.]|nr:site-specific integrase [Ottowia sp.]